MVCQPAFAVLDRDSIRSAQCLPFKNLMHTLVTRILRRSVVPLEEQPTRLRLGEFVHCIVSHLGMFSFQNFK